MLGVAIGVQAPVLHVADDTDNFPKAVNQTIYLMLGVPYASLIVGAYHTAGQLYHQNKDPYPWAEQLDKVKAKDAAGLLKE